MAERDSEMVENACLCAQNITRVYHDDAGREVLALDRFSLDVGAGEFVALVGPSGCGKSTFLRLAAGLDQPQGGILTYHGTSISGPHYDRGFVFQDPNLFPWLSVYNNIAFGLKARKVFKEERAKVQEYIRLVGLEGFEQAYPYQISGGMASRTAIARTFIQNPGLILLDEPLSALDAFTRMAIQEEIIRIWRRDKPLIVLVTHDIEEAVALSDRVVIMSSRPGRVVGEVPIPMEHPRDRTSKKFVRLRREIMYILAGCARVSNIVEREAIFNEKKIRGFLIAMLTFTLILAGCGTTATSDRNTENQGSGDNDLLHAVVGYWGGTCESPIFVAYEKGYFKEVGLDVELLKINGDVAVLMANNQLDAFELTPDKFKPMEQGLELKIIDSLHKGCIQGAASTASGIKSVADLEGKTVAAAVGGIAQIQISSQMVKLGLDPNKVNWVSYPNAQMEQALNQGEIDAFAAYDPYPEMAVQNGKVRFYSNTFDEGLKDYLCCFIGMNQKTLEANPEIAKRMSKAFKKACEYLAGNPPEAAQMEMEKGYIAGEATLNAQLIF